MRSRQSVTGRPTPTIAARRSFMDRYLEFVAPDLDTTDLQREAVDAGGVRVEWCIPSGWNEERVVVHVHGGGFVMGSPNSHFELAGRIRGRPVPLRLLSTTAWHLSTLGRRP